MHVSQLVKFNSRMQKLPSLAVYTSSLAINLVHRKLYSRRKCKVELTDADAQEL